METSADTLVEREALERYASAMHKKVFVSRAELDSPEYKPMLEMYAWCKTHRDLLVLKNGSILTCNPTSRHIQNCKTVMLDKGFKPAGVMLATQELISLIFEEIGDGTSQEKNVQVVSDQQKQLRKLILDAVKQHASDIHIEVRENISRIRFRKNGEMRLYAEWLPQQAREVASVAFNKETDHATSHFNPLIPQDASMPLQIEGRSVRLRLASLPAHGGFDMVLRVLATGDDSAPSLDKLGYTKDQVAIIQRATQMPNGAIIVSGPTGSGKTTTLASCMQLIDDKRKVYTIEDPVEKLIPNATQVPVNTEKEDRDFASMGRAALRMDPDDIVLGEMRDEETARVMVRAAITGHLIFSTLHTNSATAIVTRLVDMGISPVLLSDSNLLVCLISQRLAPKLCDQCKRLLSEAQSYQENWPRWLEFFGDNFGKIYCRGNNAECKACKGSGISGRTVIAEVIWVDEPGREFVQKGDTLNWNRYLKEHGWKSYWDHAVDLVQAGIIDPLDAEGLIGQISKWGLSSEPFQYKE